MICCLKWDARCCFVVTIPEKNAVLVFFPDYSLAPAGPAPATPVRQFLMHHPVLSQNGPPPGNLIQQVMHLSPSAIPPSPIPSLFLWNRLFFLGLSLLLLVLTIYGTHALRRHA